MGDFRASIKITFEMFDKKEKIDMWINYWPYSECDGVDQRVIDFFRENWEKFKRKHDSIVRKADTKRREAEEKENDLDELARLKKKYPTKLSVKG